MARKKRHKNKIEKKIYAIIVDGETEVWYFQMLKKHESLLNIDIRPELPKKKKLAEQFKSVLENKDIGYDKVIWLLDMDTILKEDGQTKKGQKSKLQTLQEYIKKLKRYPQIEILVNTPCLEFWHLLHFEASGKFFPKCEDASRILKKHLPKYQKTRNYYTKQDNDIYIQLKSHLARGISNAEKLGELDFDLPQSAKAEIYKVFDILNII